MVWGQRIDSFDGGVDDEHNSVSCNNEKVERVSKFKYLGVILDQNLKFNEHTDFVKRKTFAKMKALARIRQFVTQGVSLQLYKSLIIPHVDYGDVLYDSLSKGDAKKLQIIQNKCLRICLKSDPLSSAGSPRSASRRTCS